MSIASEITRIINAKASIKNAIINKGVSVSDNEKIDTYASKIAAIPSGGGQTGSGTYELGLKIIPDNNKNFSFRQEIGDVLRDWLYEGCDFSIMVATDSIYSTDETMYFTLDANGQYTIVYDISGYGYCDENASNPGLRDLSSTYTIQEDATYFEVKRLTITAVDQTIDYGKEFTNIFSTFMTPKFEA